MTPERIEQERKAFEAWMAERYPTDPKTEREGDEYSRLGTQYKWEGWQARAAQSEWISVADRLPDKPSTEQFFLIYDENHKDKLKFGVAMFTGWEKENPTAWRNWVVYGSYTPEFVTHWQPLPEPPETIGK